MFIVLFEGGFIVLSAAKDGCSTIELEEETFTDEDGLSVATFSSIVGVSLERTGLFCLRLLPYFW